MSAVARHVIGVDPDEDERYHRQGLISWWDQDRLSEASLLVVGGGALGNELVKNLALMGVGRMVICDLDQVENSNLARCVFFRESDEGRPKVSVLAERIADLNPDISVIPIHGDVRTSVGLGVFEEVDLVVAGLDSREARLFVNQACWKTSTPWVDGAMEGLMGVARVFVPPDTACYECTMGAADRQMVARRRACSLLTREEMVEGKVPTTATTSSVIAGIQSQEAIKLLHRDQIETTSALVGAGYQFVGPSHDSYVVKYERREECLAHDTYDLSDAQDLEPDQTFSAIIDQARERLGSEVVIELEHDIAIRATCQECGATESFLKPMNSLSAGSGVCLHCEREWRIDFTHRISDGDELADLTPAEVALPPADVVTARAGDRRVHFQVTGGLSALDCLTAAVAV